MEGVRDAMGFLTVHGDIESWLEKAAAEYCELSQREYVALVAEWRENFEEALDGEYREGRAAQRAIVRLLPANLFIFSVPGYPWLPAGTHPKGDPSYGDRAMELKAIHFSVVNAADAILVDQDFTSAYLGTHEAGAFSEPWFVDGWLVGWLGRGAFA